MDGFFNVFKPEGWTSFDVVASLRRPLGTRRVGHGGTLDPIATGVLPIAVGYATRLLEPLVEGDKEYVGDIELGTATDTYDRAGIETARGDWTGVTPERIEEVMRGFVGSIKQTPPPYSAVKVAGEPAYRRVRRGETVALQQRDALVKKLELLRFEPPVLSLRIVCGKGTYVRSIAHDAGELLGCHAHLRSLERTRVGTMHVAASIPIEDLRDEISAGMAHAHLRAPDTVLLDSWAAVLSQRTTAAVTQGQVVRLYPGLPEGAGRRLPLGQICRAYSSDGRFLATLEYAGPPALWRPTKVFRNFEGPNIGTDSGKLAKSGISSSKTPSQA